MRYARFVSAASLVVMASCHGEPSHDPHDPPGTAPSSSAPSPSGDFIKASMVPWPDKTGPYALVVTSKATGRVTTYDNALAALVFVRRGGSGRDDAARLLAGLARLQGEDGSLPFSFGLPSPDPNAQYLRSGAMAWAGYAATSYLDADRGGLHRDVIARMAHKIAGYLLAHQVAREGDARDGLVLGGSGRFRYEKTPQGVKQSFVAGDIAWASTEHNIDAFFFLRALGRITGEARYTDAAARVARGLSRAWNADAGQFRRGTSEGGGDSGLALDCASWGALFLDATGEGARAETAASIADARYASRDPESGAPGHKPYVHAPLVEDGDLARHVLADMPIKNWDQMSAVWPEGSAGVALAAFRVGDQKRALAILEGLERLRDAQGALPTLTAKIPFEFDTEGSVAGTAWVELVRSEMQRPKEKGTFWAR